jgi:hypothetical protein
MTTDGDMFGARELGWPDWPPGLRDLHRPGGGEPARRPLETDDEQDYDPEWFQVLVVEPA